MLRVLKAAKLPLYFTPHGLRHTYASILLAEGVSPVYVQEQLGHATIELTVSTYGRWLKKKAPGALDRLDSVAVPQSGSKVVAEGAFAVGGVGTPLAGVPYIQALKWTGIRIERTTCGLRNLSAQYAVSLRHHS
jgi:integrase